MNVEELRAFCLSLSPSVEEKFPFPKFKATKDILAFFINGHIFCFFDINDISKTTIKCEPDKIDELKEHYDFIGKPYNFNPKYWIGIDAGIADRCILERLIKNSFNIVKDKSSTEAK